MIEIIFIGTLVTVRISMGFSLRPAKWNFFSLASSKRTSRTAKEQFKELIFSLKLIFWDIYIAKSLQPKKVIVLDNNDCCKGWTLNGTLQKDFSSAIFAEPKPFCKVPLRVHPLPHSFLSTKRTIDWGTLRLTLVNEKVKYS